MSTEWVKGDDGELYPLALDESNFEKYIIGSYRTDEDLPTQIELKTDSDCKLAAQEVCFPIIMEDERYRSVPNKIILALKNFFSEGTGLICGVMSAGFGMLIPVMNKGIAAINEALFCGGIGLTAYIFFLIFLNKFCGLKAYGLSKDTDIWTIDFKEETVVQAKPISVSIANNDFKETEFCCCINGNEYYLNGDDVYFSKEAAVNVLNFVVKSNDRELKRYYPNWKNDSNFVEFYKRNIGRYGFNGFRSHAILADHVEINGITYFPRTST